MFSSRPNFSFIVNYFLMIHLFVSQLWYSSLFLWNKYGFMYIVFFYSIIIWLATKKHLIVFFFLLLEIIWYVSIIGSKTSDAAGQLNQRGEGNLAKPGVSECSLKMLINSQLNHSTNFPPGLSNHHGGNVKGATPWKIHCLTKNRNKFAGNGCWVASNYVAGQNLKLV